MATGSRPSIDIHQDLELNDSLGNKLHRRSSASSIQSKSSALPSAGPKYKRKNTSPNINPPAFSYRFKNTTPPQKRLPSIPKPLPKLPQSNPLKVRNVRPNSTQTKSRTFSVEHPSAAQLPMSYTIPDDEVEHRSDNVSCCTGSSTQYAAIFVNRLLEHYLIRTEHPLYLLQNHCTKKVHHIAFNLSDKFLDSMTSLEIRVSKCKLVLLFVLLFLLQLLF